MEAAKRRSGRWDHAIDTQAVCRCLALFSVFWRKSFFTPMATCHLDGVKRSQSAVAKDTEIMTLSGDPVSKRVYVSAQWHKGLHDAILTLEIFATCGNLTHRRCQTVAKCGVNWHQDFDTQPPSRQWNDAGVDAGWWQSVSILTKMAWIFGDRRCKFSPRDTDQRR